MFCFMRLTGLILAFPAHGAVEAPEGWTACAWIRAENDGSGAGFIVDSQKKWLVTCRHVVADRDKVDVYFPWFNDGKLITERSEYLGNRPRLRELGLLVTGKVLQRSDAADLALVELESMPHGVAALRGAGTTLQPGDALRVIGHRIDLDTLFNVTTGPVRQTGRLSEGYHWRGKKLAAGADVIIGQLPIEEGDSGGPVLNSRGELVGMASALRRQTSSAAVIISAAEIRKFLAVDESQAKTEPAGIGDKLIRATVRIRPTATDVHLAGVLFEKNLILTSARGLRGATHVGIAFPLFEKGKFVSERERYKDAADIYMRRFWSVGVVVASDPSRDLAVIHVGSVPATARPLSLSERTAEIGETVHSMSHPAGLEFVWVYANGSIRQRGLVALGEPKNACKIETHVLQLPTQASSPGGPVVNNRGELLGVIASRESAQQTGYSASTDELRRFLDIALTDRPARTGAGLIARFEAVRNWLSSAASLLIAGCASFPHTAKDELVYRLALGLDPGNYTVRHALINLLHGLDRQDEIRKELDLAIEHNRDVVGARAWLFLSAKYHVREEQWQAARGDLERLLEIYPADGPSYRELVRVYLQLKKDDDAARAVGDAIRCPYGDLASIAYDLLTQANTLAKKFPNTPSVPANWLNKAIGAAHKSTPDPKQKAEFEVVLKAAADALDDAARLAILRAFLEKLSQKE